MRYFFQRYTVKEEFRNYDFSFDLESLLYLRIEFCPRLVDRRFISFMDVFVVNVDEQMRLLIGCMSEESTKFDLTDDLESAIEI